LLQRKHKIKTYVHVIQPSKTKGAWSTAKINAMLQYTNKKFKDTPFKLIKKGVTRTVSKRWYNCGDSRGMSAAYRIM
jgi:hypothetical protein